MEKAKGGGEMDSGANENWGILRLKNYCYRQERPTLAEEERVEKNYRAAFDLLEELKMETRSKQRQSTLANFITPMCVFLTRILIVPSDKRTSSLI